MRAEDLTREQENEMTLLLQDDYSAVKRTADRILPRAKRDGWVCPSCGDGSGKTGSGMVLRHGLHEKRIYCRRCGESNFLIWLIAKQNGHSRPTRGDFTQMYQAALDAGIQPYYQGYRD